MNAAILLETPTEDLKSKIMELQSALFFTDSASIVKLPTHVISDVEIDEEGQIWFVVPRPLQHIGAFEKEIPAKLDFFRKGKDFFVKARGVAILMADSSETDGIESLSAELREKMRDEKLMGIKVLVQETALVDNTPKPKPTYNWFQNSRSHLSSLFF